MPFSKLYKRCSINEKFGSGRSCQIRITTALCYGPTNSTRPATPCSGILCEARLATTASIHVTCSRDDCSSWSDSHSGVCAKNNHPEIFKIQSCIQPPGPPSINVDGWCLRSGNYDCFFSQEQTIQSISNTQQHWYWGVKGGIVHYHTDDCFLRRHRYSSDALSLFVVILLLWSACACVRRWNRLGIWDACCNQTNTSVLGACNACLKPP